jgi:hypothetical protein
MQHFFHQEAAEIACWGRDKLLFRKKNGGIF